MAIAGHPARAEDLERASSGLGSSAALTDCTFLAAVTALSVAAYVRGLGFYYDDYPILSHMAAARDQSLLGLYDAARPFTGQRPLQAVVFATLFRVFHLHPLGYHLSNAGLLVVVACLLYLVLRELRLPRLLCVAVPLVYATLPHYATDRFWLGAFPTNLSTLLYLLSLYASLRALRARLPLRAVWLVIAVGGIAASVLAYELVFPLFAVNVGLLWWAARRTEGGRVDTRAARVTIGLVVLSVIGSGAMKIVLVAEHGQNGYQVGVGGGYAHHIAYLVTGALKVNLGTYFAALPYVLWWIVRHRLSAANVAAALGSGLLALAYIRQVARRNVEIFAERAAWLRLAGVGGVAFVLGYATFLVNQNVLFRSAGLDNRINAGAALGVAGVLVGLAGLVAQTASVRVRPLLVSVMLACSVAAGVLIVDTLGSYWTSAAQRQKSLVSSVLRTASPLNPSSTVILDGACPEVGPAVVFADQWDFRSALRLATGQPSLVADVASEGLRSTRTGLVVQMTFLGAVSTRTYRYSPHLLVYDSANQRLYHLRGPVAAARYLTRSRPSFTCRPQRSFAWGFDPSRRFSLP